MQKTLADYRLLVGRLFDTLLAELKPGTIVQQTPEEATASLVAVDAKLQREAAKALEHQRIQDEITATTASIAEKASYTT